MDQAKRVSKTAHLADLTSYGHLLKYLAFDPAINALFEVKRGLELGDVGDAMLRGDPEDLKKFKEWVVAGKIDMNPDFPSDQAVDCIRLEPYYIFQDRNKKYI